MPDPIRTLTGAAYRTRWDSNRRRGSMKYLTVRQRIFRSALAKARIRRRIILRNRRYAQRVSAAKRQLMGRYSALPAHLRNKIRSYM